MTKLGLLIGIGTLALCSCGGPSWVDQALPSELPTEAVLATSSDSGLREGCQAAAFRLTEEAARKIRKRGLEYFPSRTGSDPHGGWRETPGEIDIQKNGHGAAVTFFGLYALGGCGESEGARLHSAEFREALQQPGSYYKSGGNLEGIIIVVPQSRLVGYFYFG